MHRLYIESHFRHLARGLPYNHRRRLLEHSVGALLSPSFLSFPPPPSPSFRLSFSLLFPCLLLATAEESGGALKLLSGARPPNDIGAFWAEK